MIELLSAINFEYVDTFIRDKLLLTHAIPYDFNANMCRKEHATEEETVNNRLHLINYEGEIRPK